MARQRQHYVGLFGSAPQARQGGSDRVIVGQQAHVLDTRRSRLGRDQGVAGLEQAPLGQRLDGGLGVGLRMMFTPRTDVEGAMPACGGPCDQASAPAGWDRSFLFDITVTFGK